MSNSESNSEIQNESRRLFLKSSAAVGAGLVIGYYLPQARNKAFAAAGANGSSAVVAPNAFIQITPDNQITMVINKLEMGQGVNTSMAQILAEELGCDWKQVKSVSAPVNAIYNHTAFGTQMTGGSTALISSYDQHRKIGAAAKEMLVSAASKKWDVPAAECSVKEGFIFHPKKGKFSFGEVAELANTLPVPQNPKLKNPKDFTLIGKSVQRVDAKSKANGTAIFGMDVQIPGMLYAVIARPPAFGAKLVSYKDKAAKSVPGVVAIVKLSNSVAVLGTNTFIAQKGRDLLEVNWNSDSVQGLSSEKIFEQYKAESKKSGAIARNTGDAPKAIQEATKKLEMEFEFPYLAHACMEPMNCTVNYNGKTAEIWSGHQMPTIDRDTAAKILGLSNDKVTVNTVYAGGSFGRRANKHSDYVVEACEIARSVKKPLKVVWLREDDTRGGYYRPLTYHKVSLGLDHQNNIQGWHHHIVGQSVVAESFFEAMMVKDGLDHLMVEGVGDTKYDIPNMKVEGHLQKQPISTLWWRAVGHTHTAFVMETVIDELAAEAKQDPLQFRKKLLAKSPRHMSVLNLLEKNGWGKKVGKNRAWGLAVHESFNSVVGQAVEVSIIGSEIKVHQVICAVDCGLVVNPEGAKSQIHGGIVYGMSAALFGEIQITDGKPVQGNFSDYPVLRMNQMPKVSVHFVKSTANPTGLGEPGVPPIAPAIANAIFKLNGQRLRQLPFSKSLKA
ncbi:MAG: molybdopterin cofactor-binding domain-containing protein [Pseudobdellovibrionaceae bacterium]